MRGGRFLWPVMGFVAVAVVALALACAGNAPSPFSEQACRSLRLTPPAGDFWPGQVIAGFKEGTTLEEAEALLESYGLTIERVPSDRHWQQGVRAILVCVDPGQEEDWIGRLSAEESVEYAELSGVVRTQAGR